MPSLPLEFVQLSFRPQYRPVFKNRGCGSAVLWCILATTLASTPAAAQSEKPEDALLSSGYIFSGTVVERPQQVPRTFRPSDVQAIRVKEVIAQPELIRLKPGDRVFLITSGGSLRTGEEAVFFAQASEIGREIVLKELTHRSMDVSTQALREKVMEAQQNAESTQLRARIDSAPMVVAGRVVEIKEVLENRPVYTEHNPFWQDAIVQITTVLKGETTQESVVVRFASSNDIAWVSSPKFRVGQTAIWVLRHPPASKQTPIPTIPETVFVAPNPRDVRRINELNRIRLLIGQPTHNPNP